MSSILQTPIWDLDSSVLDTYYLMGHSGNKICSVMVDNLFDDEDDPELTNEDITTLANIILAIYGDNWRRLWDVYSAEYDPIQPYDITEHKEQEEDKLDTPTNWRNTIEDDSTVANQTSSQSSDTSNTNNSIYGYDSQSASPSTTTSDTSSSSGSGSDTTTTDATRTETRSGTYKVDDDLEYTLTRKGNIGNTLFSDILNKEIELWKWNFAEQLFSDVDKILTISIY